MAEKKRLIIGITILFLCGGGMLFFLDTLEMNRAGKGDLPFTLWSGLILAFMFAGVLALLARECSLITKKIERYERDTEEADRSLKEAQADFNETVERRTFEISVINGSLNREIAERMQAETEEKKTAAPDGAYPRVCRRGYFWSGQQR